MTEPILIAQDLHKSYGDVKAVDGISLQVARGEVFGLLGPNGAGKTTVISMLTGLFPPDSGSIIVDGLDIKTDTNAVKAKLGLVPQELALYPTLSARQNLMFFGRIYGLRGKQLRGRVDALLEMVAQGLSNREIATRLSLAHGTVKNYVANILQKLDVRDRTQAALRARELGII